LLSSATLQPCNAPRPSLGAPTEGDGHAFLGPLRWGPIAEFSRKKIRGIRAAALFYSLIESAKLCGIEPRTYLREATLRAVRNPGTATLARDLKSPKS
jgi:hypothetical protein